MSIDEILANGVAASQEIEPKPASVDTVDLQEMDVVLLRGVEGGAASDSEGSFDIGDMIADGIEEVEKQRAELSTGSSSEGSGTSFKIDTMTAVAGAVFYTDVILPAIIGGIGEFFAGEGYKYKSLGKRFDQSYKETITRLLESGQITLPTPMQCFVAMTAAIVISNVFSIVKERKKQSRKIEREKKRELFDESAPVEMPSESASPIPSDVSVEVSKRKKFQIEDGFYVYDLEGVYIKKGQRKYGPSTYAKDAIAKTSNNQEIKEMLKKGKK